MEVVSKADSIKWRIPFFLSLIIILGLSIRFYNFPSDIPIVTDGFFSFVYAVKTTFDGNLPAGYAATNTGWANVLSLIFWLVDKSDPMHIMNIQRITSIVISALTIIPAYTIFRKFTNSKLSLLGCILIAVEPRLLLISLEGINYTLYFFLFVSSIALFLHRTNLSLIFCFICLSFGILVRYEALLMIVPFTIMYFIKMRDKKSILRFCLLIGIMGLILIPIGTYRIQETQNICNEYVIIGKTCGEDGFLLTYFSNLTFIKNQLISEDDTIEIGSQESIPIQGQKIEDDDKSISYSGSVTRFLKFMGLMLLPFFIFFLALNIITRLKNNQKFQINFNHAMLFFVSGIMLLPAAYAYARGIDEIRYILVCILLVSVFSISFSKYFSQKIEQDKKIFVSLIIFSIIFSIGFIEVEKRDHVFDMESFNISKKIISLTDITNAYDNAGYVKTAILFKEWPELPKANLINGKIDSSFQKISTKNFTTIDEFIIHSKQTGLKIFVVDKNERLFDELRKNPDAYPYLEMIFDSKNDTYQNEFLIFEINFQKFER